VKKTALALVLVFALLFLVMSETRLAQAGYEEFEGLPYDPPIVTIDSPSMNGIYSEPDVPLNVTVQIRGFIYHNVETIRWLNYSLDGQTAIPMTLIVPSELTPPYYVHGNDVLTGLSDGTHNLTIYGETAVSGLTGDFNATVSFTVDTSTTPITEPFPTTLVAAALAVVAVVGIGLIIHFKKRHSQTEH
jgi:hypothetical protein